MSVSSEQQVQRGDDRGESLPPPLSGGEKCALTGLVLGLASLATWFILPMGLVLGVPGLIVSYLGRRSKKRHLARAGMLTAAIGIVGSLAMLGVIGYLRATGSP